MIRIRFERDPAFWTWVASHEEVLATIYGQDPSFIGALAENPLVTPLAAQHGGYLLTQLDAFGFTVEAHSLFTRPGWGREAVLAARDTLAFAFGVAPLPGTDLMMPRPVQVVVTQEVRGNLRSRPWKGIGFARAGDWRATPYGDMRAWVLTREAWIAAGGHIGRMN